ncbi:MAG: hypothetical protein ACYCW6_03625 [Candidatus Xenobia bacterium]
MGTYVFQGYDLEGHPQSGTVEADDELSAKARVESKQIRVTHLHVSKVEKAATGTLRSVYTIVQVIYTLLTPTCMVGAMVAWNWPVNLLDGQWYMVFAGPAAGISLFIIGLLMTSKGEHWGSSIAMSIVTCVVITAGLCCLLHVANWYLDTGKAVTREVRVVSSGQDGVEVKLSDGSYESWRLRPPPKAGERLLVRVRPGFLGKAWIASWMVASQTH